VGKPFEDELSALPETYRWALKAPVDELANGIEKLLELPLFAVGSGGSYSVCHFASHVHNFYAGQYASPITPLQVTGHKAPREHAGVLVPTASGGNPDIVSAVKLLAEQEPRTLLVLCGKKNSRVAEISERYQFIKVLTYDFPFGKDGFLATNSLLAFCLLLSRAYAQIVDRKHEAPNKLESLLCAKSIDAKRRSIDEGMAKLLNRETLIVLHGSSTLSAGVDLESKFSEAALGNVQVCDFRQFAHGRHHWLAKRSSTTGVLAISAPNDEVVSSRTLSFLPRDVPMYTLPLGHNGWVGDLEAIVSGFYITSAAGRLRNIDPGRPGVPAFGRRLYHANVYGRSARNSAGKTWKIRSIERKSGQTVEQLSGNGHMDFWNSAFDEFVDGLEEARFIGLVVDYDGTLCDEDERFEPLPAAIRTALNSFLKSGAILGVATGRGKSVRESLRKGISRSLWNRVVIGYYNGSVISRLDSPSLPDANAPLCLELRPLKDAICADEILSSNVEFRPHQITLQVPSGRTLGQLWEYVASLVHEVSPGEVHVMRSGHSIDILPNLVSKLAVVNEVRRIAGFGADAPVLRIGDQGRWPGNDSQLLASEHGLSVYNVSSDSRNCWNLAPPGWRGRQATLSYLRSLSISRRGIRLRFSLAAGDI